MFFTVKKFKKLVHGRDFTFDAFYNITFCSKQEPKVELFLKILLTNIYIATVGPYKCPFDLLVKKFKLEKVMSEFGLKRKQGTVQKPQALVHRYS